MAEEIINGNATENSGTENQQTERTFTQTEVDNLINRRLRREREGMPTQDELAAFRKWQQGQQTEADKLENMTKERDSEHAARVAAEEKITQYEREKYLTGKGVEADDLDYYCFKIGQLVTDKVDFESAADKFFKDHKPRSVRMSTGASLENNGGTMTKDDIMKIKDPVQRQEAIAQNIALFTKG